MFTIGDFSKLCWVSKKTLRHYDEIDLLKPKLIGANGYRYYTALQLREMRLISKLRNYGFGLKEITTLLKSENKEILKEAFLKRQLSLLKELEEKTTLLTQLQTDLSHMQKGIDFMKQNITIQTTTLNPTTIFGIRKEMSVYGLGKGFEELFQLAAKKGYTPMGPPVAIYHSEDFNLEKSDIEMALPVNKKTEETTEIKGGLYCFATHLGTYETLSETYSALGEWIEANGYQITGPAFDKYLRQEAGEQAITEVYFPIGK